MSAFEHAAADQLYDFLIELPEYIVRLALVIDNAECHDPRFVAHCFEAMRLAQQKIDRVQFPTFGPD